MFGMNLGLEWRSGVVFQVGYTFFGVGEGVVLKL